MRYMDIKVNPMPDKRTIKIPVRQLGFSQFVYVRTKKNGGIKNA